MNNSFYTNYGIPYSVYNSDMIHGDRVKDIYKEINFVAQTTLTKALTTILIVI